VLASNPNSIGPICLQQPAPDLGRHYGGLCRPTLADSTWFLQHAQWAGRGSFESCQQRSAPAVSVQPDPARFHSAVVPGVGSRHAQSPGPEADGLCSVGRREMCCGCGRGLQTPVLMARPVQRYETGGPHHGCEELAGRILPEAIRHLESSQSVSGSSGGPRSAISGSPPYQVQADVALHQKSSEAKRSRSRDTLVSRPLPRAGPCPDGSRTRPLPCLGDVICKRLRTQFEVWLMSPPHALSLSLIRVREKHSCPSRWRTCDRSKRFNGVGHWSSQKGDGYNQADPFEVGDVWMRVSLFPTQLPKALPCVSDYSWRSRHACAGCIERCFDFLQAVLSHAPLDRLGILLEASAGIIYS